jgi:hypothetical protein
LAIATNGAEPYKSRLKEMFPQMITPQPIGGRGWTAIRALPYLDTGARDQPREAVKTYMAGLDKQLDATPFGVPPTRMYFLHKAFPDLVSPEYALRAANYILGSASAGAPIAPASLLKQERQELMQAAPPAQPLVSGLQDS